MDEYRHNKILFFDIETVFDSDCAKRHLNLPYETPQSDVELALTQYHLQITDGKNSFFRQLFWKIVCVSYVEASICYDSDGESYSVINVKSGGGINSNEKEIITAMFNYLNKEKPRIVSFNGRYFDIPVLKYRSMLHKIPAPWYYRTGSKWSNYGQKYSTDWQCDLLDALSDFGSSAKIKMSEVASLLSIPCKTDIDGSMVANLYKNNEIEKIRKYCEEDCLCTFVLYLYYALHQSRITHRAFDYAIESLQNFAIKQDSMGFDVLHIKNFLDKLGNL
jgi:predicted PolB exonuclease-like 3'-5' exonuclease